jgi:hypothetical protein
MADVAFDQDTVNKMIDAYSTRNFSLRQVSGSDQFFSTFDLFSMATIGREGDMLNEVTLRAHRQNTFYLELMQSWGMTAARAAARASIRGGVIDDAILNPVLDDIATTTLSLIDVAEQRRRELQSCGEKIGVSVCNVEVTYLEQVLRTFSRAEVRAQTRLAVKLIERDIRIVGLNFVAREDHPITLRDHRWQMEMIAAETQVLAEEQRQISMHAGELTLGLVPPESLGSHIREAVEVAGATRIGHGVDITYDLARNDLLNRMALDRIAIEINLTSNANILGISGAEHPFNLYRQFKVPLTLSTDDEGVSRIDLTHEYQRAVETYDLSYSDIKELSRNALRYSFQPGESLFTAHSGTGFVRQCKRVKVRAPSISNQCQIFLAGNPKARMQFDLERRFADFEANFN